MYGKHRVVLKPDSKQRVIVAGKRTPGSKGGSFHPMGFWAFDTDHYIAYVRSPQQWSQLVSRDELTTHFTAATKKELRALILSYYDGVSCGAIDA
jgi:hypothetical protein